MKNILVNQGRLMKIKAIRSSNASTFNFERLDKFSKSYQDTYIHRSFLKYEAKFGLVFDLLILTNISKVYKGDKLHILVIIENLSIFLIKNIQIYVILIKKFVLLQISYRKADTISKEIKKKSNIEEKYVIKQI